MASAIAQHLDQFQAASNESNQSNDFHRRRATVDYIPKAHSKLPFLYAPVSWDMIDSDQYRELSGEAVKLYVYLSRHVDLRIKQKTRGNREYLMGRTFAKKYDTIVEECYGGRRSIRSIQRYAAELEKANLIEVDKGWGNVCTFTLMAYHQTDKIEEYETNAVQREFEIQQAALKNNKLRLLRHEKDEVIEVEAPQVMTEPLAETAVDEPDTTDVSTPDTTPVSTLNIKEINLTETPSSNPQIPAQLEFNSSSDNYDSLKLQTLELWCNQQHKLGNLPPTAADRYQIMRPDHQLGIDAFVAEAIRLSPNLIATQALKLLQSCIKIMPKTGGNSRPVGRPGWFLLSASEQYFKRAWANTFDFLPAHWQNQPQSAGRRPFNRTKPLANPIDTTCAQGGLHP
jgi:hypothetical protein